MKTDGPKVQGFFDAATSTVTYLVRDPGTKRAVVIDPVLDYDPVEGTLSTRSADAVLAEAARQGLTIERVLETHAHADHLSGARRIKDRTGARIGAGSRMTEVQRAFAPAFGAAPDPAAFDDLFEDGASFALGGSQVKVLHTPGHTPACVTYLIGDAAFVGDTVFMPDFGSARCDFPGGDARTLYRSIRRILSHPPGTRLFVGHDYPAAAGRSKPAWETTVAEQRASNAHVSYGVSEEEFLALRVQRDAQLKPPALLFPALQVNIRAGLAPEPGPDGRVTFAPPLKVSA
ncbi:MAG TPA: MBL fold metallo-hydrolase [Caulobacteraceae bacterium]|nr:MBL fold metallo-hydrolase [Caulobacteraceae bacterium]